MNWTALGAVAEIVSAVAVLVTLVYLALQIRQAKEQIDLAGQRHRADAARDVLSSISDSDHLAPIFAKLGGFPGWDTEDSVRVYSWCHAWMRTEEMNFRMASPEQRATQAQLLKGWLSVPWAANFWEENKAIYDADFAEAMDSIQAELVREGRSTAEIFADRRE